MFQEVPRSVSAGTSLLPAGCRTAGKGVCLSVLHRLLRACGWCFETKFTELQPSLARMFIHKTEMWRNVDRNVWNLRAESIAQKHWLVRQIWQNVQSTKPNIFFSREMKHLLLRPISFPRISMMTFSHTCMAGNLIWEEQFSWRWERVHRQCSIQVPRLANFVLESWNDLSLFYSKFENWHTEWFSFEYILRYHGDPKKNVPQWSTTGSAGSNTYVLLCFGTLGCANASEQSQILCVLFYWYLN